MDIVTNAQIGDSTDREFLESLGVRNFDYVIIAIAGDFESSMITTVMVKELGAPNVISRASSEIQEQLLKIMGRMSLFIRKRPLVFGRLTAMFQNMF